MPEEETIEQATAVALRPVAASDEEFLLAVYAAARADEMARVPWSLPQKEAFIKMQFDAQQAHYRTHNPNASHDVILLSGQAIGRLYVARRDREIRILDITILPDYRNRGIGTPLIEDLMREAAHADKPLTIYVESFNPSHGLFDRLGFSKIEDDGVNHLLEWRAQS
ncbi:MAG TPA: GNAT family N-acetyltransferase [Pyrinomonadaceae bacterium]|nr:GNAT family N-acetyltransferase [Pyrinomonadaceae bacterium]